MPAETCKEIKQSEGEWADNGNYWLHFLEIAKIVLDYCDMKTEGKDNIYGPYLNDMTRHDKI